MSSNSFHIHTISTNYIKFLQILSNIQFHLFLSTYIHLHPLSSSFIENLLSNFIYLHSFLSTFIHFHPLFLLESFLKIYYNPILSNFIHSHPFSYTLIHKNSLSSTLIHCCPLSHSSILFYTLSSSFTFFHPLSSYTISKKLYRVSTPYAEHWRHVCYGLLSPNLSELNRPP